ncbi:phosphoribosylanthranilate isomerase [Gordonia humi]|uniref:phosphoribosylanthranilate isomerase n=1 Tax=Gordonia humi TaxID=686429 RepID=UPI00360B63B3
MYVKVCGLTDPATVDVAVDAGADAIGVVMNRTSSRAVDADVARSIVERAAGRIDAVLVVNDMPAADAARIAADLGFAVVQLHGAYTADDFAAAARIHPRLWRATSLANDPPLQVGAYGEQFLLLDAPKPGSGRTWDPVVAGRRRRHRPLAPGRRPESVERRRCDRTGGPVGRRHLQRSGGLPGVKDHAKVRDFIVAAKAAGTSLT